MRQKARRVVHLEPVDYGFNVDSRGSYGRSTPWEHERACCPDRHLKCAMWWINIITLLICCGYGALFYFEMTYTTAYYTIFKYITGRTLGVDARASVADKFFADGVLNSPSVAEPFFGRTRSVSNAFFSMPRGRAAIIDELFL